MEGIQIDSPPGTSFDFICSFSRHLGISLGINQIILNDLERYDLKNEWRKLMISNLENYNLVSFDFIGFERLKSFFKLEGKNGIFFFLLY